MYPLVSDLYLLLVIYSNLWHIWAASLIDSQQYQDAIRAHKAGRPIDLSDLPVPPGSVLIPDLFKDVLPVCTVKSVYLCVAILGCPPLQGSEGGQQNLMGVLETAMKIANRDADAEDDEEDGPTEAAKVKKT